MGFRVSWPATTLLAVQGLTEAVQCLPSSPLPSTEFCSLLVGSCVAMLAVLPYFQIPKACRHAWILLLFFLSSCSLLRGWYNLFQDSYYAQDCYMKGLKPCSYPRYRWLDLLYELLFHEQCMLLLMADAGTYGNMERECYSAFSTRLMACAKVAVQCLLLAIGLGAVIVADSRPLGRQFPDEATMLAEARAEEMSQGGSRHECMEHRSPSAITDM